MSSVVTRYEHIAVGEDQIPVIAGTTMKVVELVAEKLAYGWSPEELWRCVSLGPTSSPRRKTVPSPCQTLVSWIALLL